MVKSLTRRGSSFKQIIEYLLRYTLRDDKEGLEKYAGLRDHAKIVYKKNLRARSVPDM